MKLRLRKSMGWNEFKQIYEWNPGNGKWYLIHRNNMRLQGSSTLQRNLFNALLAGLIAVVRGSYRRNKHELKLKL